MPKATGPSHATKLLNLFANLKEEWGAELFHTPSGEPYLYAPFFSAPGVITFYDSLPLHSDACGQYLRRQYYNACGKSINSTALGDAIDTLAGGAFREQERPIYLRVAGFADRILLDLANTTRQVVTITAEGWSIGPCPADVRFVRRPGMIALAEPVVSDELLQDLIPRVLNISDSQSQQLLIAWWLVALRGLPPYFVLVIRGEAGSAKTVGSIIIRSMLDPNEANNSSAPKDERDLMIAARSSYVHAEDNLRRIDDERSDWLCKLSTGSGLRTRKLMTDDTEIIFKAASPIILNGIPDLLNREDLASRALVIELEPISEESRQTEAEVYARVAAESPKILGKLLTVLVDVIRKLPTFRPARLARMADASLVVMAAEDALGWPEGTFLKLLEEGASRNASAILDGDPIYEGILKLELPWRGPVKVLKEKHLPFDLRDGMNRPMNEKAIGNHLRRLSGALRNAGIIMKAPMNKESLGEYRGKRVWSFKRIDPETAPAQAPTLPLEQTPF